MVAAVEVPLLHLPTFSIATCAFLVGHLTSYEMARAQTLAALDPPIQSSPPGTASPFASAHGYMT